MSEEERHVDVFDLEFWPFRTPSEGRLTGVHQGDTVEVEPEGGGGRDVRDGEEAA